MNLTPQWLAVSSGPLSRIHLVGRRSGLPRWDNTVHPLLCDSVPCPFFPKNYHNLHILIDMERSLYLQKRNGLYWI